MKDSKMSRVASKGALFTIILVLLVFNANSFYMNHLLPRRRIQKISKTLSKSHLHQHFIIKSKFGKIFMAMPHDLKTFNGLMGKKKKKKRNNRLDNN